MTEVAPDGSPVDVYRALPHEPDLARIRAVAPVWTWNLDLGRKFDVVMALSHLINDRSATRRIELLKVCGRHLADSGVIVLQRFPPSWSPIEESRCIGDVSVRLFDVRPFDDDGFAAAVEHRLGQRAWIQRFEAAIVDVAELNALEEGLLAPDHAPVSLLGPRRTTPCFGSL